MTSADVSVSMWQEIMGTPDNAVFWLKLICIIGFIYDLWLVAVDVRKKFADPSFSDELAKQKKHFWWNAMVGFVANFFDTLGIGSFAPSTAMYKMRGSVDDINIPGTLNAGDAFPVLAEAFLFFGFVNMDPLTLILMLVAATLGAWFGAGIVTSWNRTKVRYGMGIGLLILGCIMLSQKLGVGPFGMTGEAMGLTGVKLVIAVVVNCFLGALMNLGVGLYAPCMALCVVLGMHVGTAFPAMMGSCAYLMAFGNTPVFIKKSRYDVIGVITNGIFGCLGVLVAYFIVKSLPLAVLLWIVICVVFLTSALFLRDALKDSAAKA